MSKKKPLARVGFSLAPDILTFAVALIALQILGQLTEYDATFAAAVDLSGDRARQGMSQITLWGGLASTVFWPVTAFLLSHMTWRDMLLAYAATIGHQDHARVRFLLCGALF